MSQTISEEQRKMSKSYEKMYGAHLRICANILEGAFRPPNTESWRVRTETACGTDLVFDLETISHYERRLRLNTSL